MLPLLILRPSFFDHSIDRVGSQQPADGSFYRGRVDLLPGPQVVKLARLPTLSSCRVRPTLPKSPIEAFILLTKSQIAVTGSARSGLTFTSARPNQCVSYNWLYGRLVENLCFGPNSSRKPDVFAIVYLGDT